MPVLHEWYADCIEAVACQALIREGPLYLVSQRSTRNISIIFRTSFDGFFTYLRH